MRKIGQSLAKSLLLILLSAALGTGLLLLSELLPAGPMDRHLAGYRQVSQPVYLVYQQAG